MVYGAQSTKGDLRNAALNILVLYSVVGKTDDSSRIIIIATTVGAGVLFSIVLNIILLVKLKRRTQLRKSSTPVDISLGAAETSPEPFPIDQVNYL